MSLTKEDLLAISQLLDIKLKEGFQLSETRMDERMQSLEARLDEKMESLGSRLDEKMESQETRLDEKMESLEARLNEKMESLEARLNEKMESLETRLDEKMRSLETRLNGKMQSLEDRMQVLETKVSGIELHLENVTDKNIRILAENHLTLTDKLNQAIEVSDKTLIYELKVNLLTSKVENLEKELAELKSKIA